MYGSKSSTFNNISLALKLGIAFGFIITLTVVALAVIYDGILKISNVSRQYQSSAQQAIDLNAYLEDFLEARLAAVKYRVGYNDEFIVDVQSNVDEVVTEIRRKTQGAALSQEQAQWLQGISELARTYGERFVVATELHAVRNTLAPRLDAAGPAAIDALAQIIEGAAATGVGDVVTLAGTATRQIFEGRIATQKFLLRNQPEDAEAAEAALDQAGATMQQLVAILPTGPSSIGRWAADVQGALERYHNTFAQVRRTIEERNGILAGELDALGPEMLEQVELLLDAEIETQAALGATASAVKSATQLRTIVAGAFALVLGVVAAVVLILITTRPVRALTERLAAVANGDTEFEVREDTSRDEIGRMWAALRSLRNVVDEAFARAQMIEQLNTPVAVTALKANHKIGYLNGSARQALDVLRPALKCEPNGVLGRRPDDVFAFDHALRGRLSDPSSLPFDGPVSLGKGEHVHLSAVAIRDKQNAPTGVMLSWRRTTQQVNSTHEFEVNVKGTLEQIRSTFQNMRGDIGGMETRLDETQEQLISGAESVTEATQNVQTVAAAAEQMAASIDEVAYQLRDGSKQSMDAAQRTAEVAERAEALAKVSNRIGEVVDTISDITARTNLLALNATIEAASAGDAGRGFAVVATEVKHLANQTAKATDEVRQQVEAVQREVSTVVEGVVSVTKLMGGLKEVFVSAANSAEEQQAATRQITEGAQRAAQGADAASQIIRSVESSSDSNLKATRELTAAAGELAEANDNLSQQSDAFLQTMKNGAQ